jgi:hypothetical protein
MSWIMVIPRFCLVQLLLARVVVVVAKVELVAAYFAANLSLPGYFLKEDHLALAPIT